MAALIQFTSKGLYCPMGKFYIDPWQPVDKAIITHAHSDHAKPGCSSYLCHYYTQPLLQLRLGNHHYQSIEWNEIIYINGVKISLHPAGHIIGSSQVRIEYNGEVWVFSGDYKTENDDISTPFEPIKCHTFITESTFGLPIYYWQPQNIIYQTIQNWIIENFKQNTNVVLFAYSLGKAQRVLKAIENITNNIYVHGSIYNTMQVLNQLKFSFPAVKKLDATTKKEDLKNCVVIAPPSANNTAWLKKFKPYKTAVCSGWMQVRGSKKQAGTDSGFALSDHADWYGLLNSIQLTNATNVFVTHGFTAVLAKQLNTMGIHAREVTTKFGIEEEIELVNNELQ